MCSHSLTFIFSGVGTLRRAPLATMAWVMPSRLASLRRWPRLGTLRISPDRLISPMPTNLLARDLPMTAEASDRQMARSLAGADSFAPPTVAVKTSLLARLEPGMFWLSTANIMATRDESTPETDLRDCPPADSVIRDWTSTSSGRLPSWVTVRQVPDGFIPLRDRKSPEGSSRLWMPFYAMSKQPTSSVGQMRLFTGCSMRRRGCRGRAYVHATSTGCSSRRGPPIVPSVVIWPTISVGRDLSFASLMRAVAPIRTWVTAPGTPPNSEEESV